MPELGSYGSVRGARGNSRPYRESFEACSGFTLVTAHRIAQQPKELMIASCAAHFETSSIHGNCSRFKASGDPACGNSCQSQGRQQARKSILALRNSFQELAFAAPDLLFGHGLIHARKPRSYAKP
jgi:hypothetical protein